MLDQAKNGANEEAVVDLLRAIKRGAHGLEHAKILGKLGAMPRYQTADGTVNTEAIYADVNIVPVTAPPARENHSATAAESKLDLQFEVLADELNGQPAQRMVWNEANTDTATEMRAQGKSIESIADVLHMSPGNVSPTLAEFPGVAERPAKREEGVDRERTEIASAAFQNAQEDNDAPADHLGRMGGLGEMSGLGEMGGLGNIQKSPADADDDSFRRATRVRMRPRKAASTTKMGWRRTARTSPTTGRCSPS